MHSFSPVYRENLGVETCAWFTAFLRPYHVAFDQLLCPLLCPYYADKNHLSGLHKARLDSRQLASLGSLSDDTSIDICCIKRAIKVKGCICVKVVFSFQ